MLISIKKKNIAIAMAIVISIIVIVVGIFLTRFILTNIKIKETENKLKAIDTKELQTKLIEELNNTKLNINIDGTNLNNMYVITIFNEGIHFKDYITATITCWRNSTIVSAIEVPCFKITSDSNGKFKNIEYTDFLFNETQVIKEVVEKVFENDYGIDLEEINKNTNIREKFYKEKSYEYTNKGNVYVDGDNFFIAVLNKVANMNIEYGENIEQFKEYKTKTFGLEF